MSCRMTKQNDLSSQYAQWVANVSSCGQRRLWSNWAYAQADLSLRWAQRSFCWFCHEAAHILKVKDIIYVAFLFSTTTPIVNWNLHVPYNLLKRPHGRAFKRSRLRITGSREVRFFPNLNGASLHRVFHVHSSIVTKWLKHCWKAP